MISIKKQRLPNFEILRVMAMLMIVVWHFYVHGLLFLSEKTDFDGIGFSLTNATDCCLYFIHQCFIIISRMGVNLFVMITGYFMITSPPKWEKVPIIWFQVMFYCVVIYAIAVGIGVADFSVKVLFEQFTPIYNNKLWFVTQYLALIILAPFINIMVRNLSKQQYRALLVVLIVMDFVIMYHVGYGKHYSCECSLNHLVMIYLLAGYIRIHAADISAKKSLIAFCLSVIAVFFMILVWGIYLNFRTNQPLGNVKLSYVFIDNNGFTIFTSLLFFLWISKVKIKQNWFTKALVWMAPYTFGVYLIHDSDYIRRLLWDSILRYADVHSPWLVAYILASCVAILLVCVGIDFVRKQLFDSLHVNERLASLSLRVEQFVKNKL